MLAPLLDHVNDVNQQPPVLLTTEVGRGVKMGGRSEAAASGATL